MGPRHDAGTDKPNTVVPVTELSHWALRKTLAEAAADTSGQPPHARAFAAWVQNEKLVHGPLLTQLAAEAAAALGPARQSAHAAVLGYAFNFDVSHEESFADAVKWLMERQYFGAGRPLTFEVDGLALMGIAVGVVSMGKANASARSWLQDLLRQSLRSNRPLDWNESLIRAAYAVLSDDGNAPVELIADDLRVALAAKALLPAPEASRENAWGVISGLGGVTDGMTRAAAQIAALTYLLREASTLRLGSTSVDDVARLLAGIDRSMRRWSWDAAPRTPNSVAARWEIENEYHVQDMLWAILAPVFPDLDDEEWLKSLGHHHPRADLSIPSLELIIEVKFIRKGGKSIFSKVIQEVAADASTYLQADSGYRHIIAFIWDDEARTEEHAELRQGLIRIRGVADAIVLSRPSKMNRDQRAA